jgi:hypothetical protein
MIDSCAGFVRLIKPVMREGHMAEAVMSSGAIPRKAGKRFPKGSGLNKNVQQQSGWLGETGKVPVILTRKDGRHPKTRNHGRIAGCWRRMAPSIPPSCTWFFVLWRLFFRKLMKEDHDV